MRSLPCRCACVTVAIGLALGCQPAGPDYAASLADVRDDVLVYARLERGEVWLSLLRWFGSGAYAYEHCPVIDARAEVNGIALELVDAGGWSPGSGGLFGSGGDCRDIHYVLRAGSAELATERVVFQIEDSSAEIALETRFFSSEPVLALSSGGALVPGTTAELLLLPSAEIVEPEACGLRYLGELESKSPLRQHAFFGVEAALLQPTEAGFAFTVPELARSRGTLRLLCGRRARIHPAYSVWPSRVTRCSGAAGCAAERWGESLAPELSVSVSDDGSEVAPDPRQDPFAWSGCGFRTPPGAVPEIYLDGAQTCSGTAIRPPGVVSGSWGRPGTAPYAELTISGLLEAAPAEALPAQLIFASGPGPLQAEDCSVDVTEVYFRDEPPGSGVLDGRGACPNVERFEFRMPFAIAR